MNTSEKTMRDRWATKKFTSLDISLAIMLRKQAGPDQKIEFRDGMPVIVDKTPFDRLFDRMRGAA